MDRSALIAAMAATPLEVRHVTVPGWGDLHVRELTTDVVDRLNRAKRGDDGINALAFCCYKTTLGMKCYSGSYKPLKKRWNGSHGKKEKHNGR